MQKATSDENNRGYQVKLVPTHFNPDPDEAAAFLLGMLYGNKNYPDMVNAKFIFVDAGSQPTVPMENWPRSGIFPIGVWGGLLDEHNKGDSELSATLLAARLFGVEDHPDVAHIIKYVHHVDAHGGGGEDDLNTVIKHVHMLTEVDDHTAMYWLIDALMVKVGDQENPSNFTVDYIRDLMTVKHSKEIADEWINVAEIAKLRQIITNQDAKKIVRGAKKNIKEIAWRGNKKLRLLVLETGNLEVGPVTFAYYKCADVLVVKRPNRQVQIQVNKKLGLKITDVVAMLNYEEQFALKHSLPSHKARRVQIVTDWNILRAVGNMPGGVWCNYNDLWALNGTRKAPHTKPTKLPLNKIVSIVKHAFDQNYFPPQYKVACRSAKCTSSQRRQCPLFFCGLDRCKRIRSARYINGVKRTDQGPRNHVEKVAHNSTSHTDLAEALRKATA